MTINNIKVLISLFIFTFFALVSPGLAVKAGAQTIDAGETGGAIPAGATEAGALAGKATTAGISKGTITVLAAVAAVGALFLLSSLGGSNNEKTTTSTSHH